jgi:polyphosphate kinase 2 (PPK2 family)
LDEANKRWKFNPDDLEERKLWPKYMKAYEDAIRKTSTSWAPWHIVPANRKWYRNLVVGTVIVETLEDLNMRHPEPQFDPADIKIE